MNCRTLRNERFRARRRPRCFRGYRYMVSKDRGYKTEEIYGRGRVRGDDVSAERCGVCGNRARPEVHRERDASLSQLHPRLQHRVRGGGYKVPWDLCGLNSAPEMAKTLGWTEGDSWSEEEETFKGSREEVISWIKTYSSHS